MYTLKVIDYLKNKELKIKVENKSEFQFRDFLLLESAKEKLVAIVIDIPRDIPGIKYEQDYKVIRKLDTKESTDFKQLQEGECKRVRKAQALAEDLGLRMHFFASRRGWNERMTSFFFTSDEAVDFRELLKLMIRDFSGRIHLERVSMRERTRMMGGFGTCGRGESCCQNTRFFNQKVSLDAVRDQGIMINNNQKIFGVHGKIKTCMLYEVDQYREKRKYLPHIRQEVQVDGQKGRVIGLDILNERVKVALENENIETFDLVDIQFENKKEVPPKEDQLDFEKYDIEVEGLGISN